VFSKRKFLSFMSIRIQRLILSLFSNIYRHPGDPLLFLMVAQVAWQNDLAEYKIRRSITFLPTEIKLLSIHHWISLEKTFHLVYYMMRNIEYEILTCYPYTNPQPIASQNSDIH
jgi:hypothetical protein